MTHTHRWRSKMVSLLVRLIWIGALVGTVFWLGVAHERRRIVKAYKVGTPTAPRAD